MTLSSQRFRFLFADDASVYGVRATGELMWFPHWTAVEAAPRATGGVRIHSGFGAFTHVFAGGGGVIYAVSANGDLLWFRDADRMGGGDWDDRSGSVIGSGWDQFCCIFSGGDGHIYAVAPDQHLYWYRDADRTGGVAWAAGSGRPIGQGWTGFRHLLSGGGGVIYAVDAAGHLRWYRDDRMDGSNGADGSSGWAGGSGGAIGGGWQYFTHVFAGAPGQIFACQTLNYGAVLRVYQDKSRQGVSDWADPIGDPWIQGQTDTFSGGWQIAAVEGYAWPMSIGPGETLSVQISGSTPQVCLADIHRLTGRGPELAQPVQGGPIALVKTDFHADQGQGVDCGWPGAFIVTAPDGAAAWPPGVYCARLNIAHGPAYDVPFVVRQGVARGEIAVVVNVNTWNAYNCWGGDSNYTETGGWIALSHKRPNHHLLTCSQDHVNGNHMLRSEIWLIDWLSARYRTDLLTDLDLHNGTDLGQYRAIILNTHPEYWSDEMVQAIQAYLDAGGSLVYLGGNGVYRPTTLSASAEGGDVDLMQTLEVQGGRPDGDFPQYGDKPLFAARVDALGGPGPGVGVTLHAGQPFVPKDVPASLVGVTGWNGPPMGGAHPWGASGLQPWGASGWETDAWQAPLPPGVAELGRDDVTPFLDSNGDVLLDKDGNYVRAGAVLATYRTGKGGFVLGVGSLTFVGALMVDPILQGLVHNALTDALRLPVAAGTIASLTLAPALIPSGGVSLASVTLTQPVSVATEVAIAVLQESGGPIGHLPPSSVASAPASLIIPAGGTVGRFQIHAAAGERGARYGALIQVVAANIVYATLTVVGAG